MYTLSAAGRVRDRTPGICHGKRLKSNLNEILKRFNEPLDIVCMRACPCAFRNVSFFCLTNRNTSTERRIILLFSATAGVTYVYLIHF